MVKIRSGREGRKKRERVGSANIEKRQRVNEGQRATAMTAGSERVAKKEEVYQE